MRITYGNLIDIQRQTYPPKGAKVRNRVRVGRDRENEVILDHPAVAPLAAILHIHNKAWELVVTGASAVEVDGRRLRNGDRAPLRDGQTIKLWPFSLDIDLPQIDALSGDLVRYALDQELTELIGTIHLQLLRRMDIETRGETHREDSDDYHITLERNVEDIARSERLLTPARQELADHTAGLAVRRQCLEVLLSRAGETPNAWRQEGQRQHKILTAVPDLETELSQFVTKTAEHLALDDVRDLTDKIKLVETKYWDHWVELRKEMFDNLHQYLCARYLKKDLKDIVFGYGPLEDLLRNPTITEIMVVDRDRIFIEKAGVLENSGRRFISDEITETIIERIVSKVGRRIDRALPLVDARLSDGSRVNAVIPPVAVSGPCLTVRKFPARKLSVDDLVEKRSLSETAAKFLRAAVLARKNILVSGGTGTGKTTLLNCLSDFIPDKERIVTIEDTAELQLMKTHVVRLETKAANVEGKGALSIRDLVKNALRMRPDRIVVGETRGPEALDMLQAMNSGHDGSLTTLHANSAADVVLRLEVLIQMAADLPIASIHRQICSAIDLVVQLHRLRNGRRVISQITEYVGIDPDLGGILTRDLFLLDEDNPEAILEPTGSMPTFTGELIAKKMLDLQTFYN